MRYDGGETTPRSGRAGVAHCVRHRLRERRDRRGGRGRSGGILTGRNEWGLADDRHCNHMVRLRKVFLATNRETCQCGYMNDAERPEDRDGFRFRGGCNAIDLPATLQARLSASPRELLTTPADLARWLVSAGMARSAPPTTESDVATARALREAIFRL